MDGLVDLDEDKNISRDSAENLPSRKCWTLENTGEGLMTGLEVLREASENTKITQLLIVEVEESVEGEDI